MPFFSNGMGLSFVALVDNICAVVSGFCGGFRDKLEYFGKGLQEFISVDRKMRAGPFINGLKVLIYERSV